MRDIQALSAGLRSARRVVVLTGAGVSAESGIPPFRDALTGLWENYDAQALATAEAFRRDPALVWGWYEWRRAKVLRAQPDPAHRSIAALEQLTPEVTLVTQNVYDLHERAGSASPIHLHGSLSQPRCFPCDRLHVLPSDVPDEPEGGRRLEPPRCLHCGGRIWPGVVWFGEGLPDAAWKDANAAVGACDLMLVIRASGLVYPAAGLPKLAAANGATIIEINPRPAELGVAGSERLVGQAGVVMPALVSAVLPP